MAAPVGSWAAGGSLAQPQVKRWPFGTEKRQQGRKARKHHETTDD